MLCALPSRGQDVSPLEELWVTERDAPPDHGLRISPEFPDRIPVKDRVDFAYTVVSAYEEKTTRVLFRILDAAGAPICSLKSDCEALRRGENRITFSWDAASALTPGSYEAVAEVFLREKTPSASVSVRFDRVSAAWMTAQAREMQAALAGAVPEAVRQSSPWLRARAALVEDGLARLEGVLAAGDWKSAVAQTAHARASLQSLRSMAALGGLVPELRQNIAREDARLDGSGVSTPAGEAVSLVGRNLAGLPGDAWKGCLERMPLYGMNFAVLPLTTLDGVAAAPFDTESIRAAVGPLLDAAEAGGIRVVVALSQDALAGIIREKSPDIMGAGFANLAHPALLAAFKEHAAAAARAVHGHPALLGISIAQSPQFKFDGEDVRLAFIEEVRTANPDRQELNQAWRAHLADYGEITIWGEHPEHAYQNRHAYQHAWQTFHRSLIQALIRDLRDTVAAAAPGTPLMLCMESDAFKKAETRNSPDREEIAGMFDTLACSQDVVCQNEVYAWNYPEPAVGQALMASYAPDKPLLDLAVTLNEVISLSPDRRTAVIRSLLWTGLVSGAAGIALAVPPELAKAPGVMDAFSQTALEARRLSGVVAALRRAPAETAVLYSDSSKVLDDGVPHLSSAQFAYEGCSFSGYAIRFVSERQLAADGTAGIRVLVMPETPAITDSAFKTLADYVENGGAVLRVGTPIPYDERGHSRTNVIRNTENTVLVRGMNMPTEYLHAMDAAIEQKVLPPIPRPINTHGYPLEGVLTRHIVLDGESYLFCVNLRKDSVRCHLDGTLLRGRDLILGREVQFPCTLASCDPMLIRMERPASVVREGLPH